MGHNKIYRVTVRLDTEHDTDLITWLEGQVPGSRSGLIRTIWRAGLKQINGPGWEPVDIEDMRSMVAEELNRALAGRQLANQPDPAQPASNADMEAKYGAKLDKMLGGLTKSHTRSDEGE
jgi:hypothetical protein